MNCPKCSSRFEEITIEDVVIDKCTGCGGVWFDMLEKEDLMKISDSETKVDQSASINEPMNEKRDINCPKCSIMMIPMVDKDHPDIKFESCTSCYGLFLDDGEFSKLKSGSFFQKLKNIIK